MARRLAAIEDISLAVILVNYDETVVNFLDTISMDNELANVHMQYTLH